MDNGSLRLDAYSDFFFLQFKLKSSLKLDFKNTTWNSWNSLHLTTILLFYWRKTGKTADLPWFCKVVQSGGSSSMLPCYSSLTLPGRTRRTGFTPGGRNTTESLEDPTCLHSSIKAVSTIFSYVWDIALLELIREVLLLQIWHRKAAFSRSLNCM